MRYNYNILYSVWLYEDVFRPMLMSREKRRKAELNPKTADKVMKEYYRILDDFHEVINIMKDNIHELNINTEKQPGQVKLFDFYEYMAENYIKHIDITQWVIDWRKAHK